MTQISLHNSQIDEMPPEVAHEAALVDEALAKLMSDEAQAFRVKGNYKVQLNRMMSGRIRKQRYIKPVLQRLGYVVHIVDYQERHAIFYPVLDTRRKQIAEFPEKYSKKLIQGLLSYYTEDLLIRKISCIVGNHYHLLPRYLESIGFTETHDPEVLVDAQHNISLGDLTIMFKDMS